MEIRGLLHPMAHPMAFTVRMGVDDGWYRYHERSDCCSDRLRYSDHERPPFGSGGQST